LPAFDKQIQLANMFFNEVEEEVDFLTAFVARTKALNHREAIREEKKRREYLKLERIR
jgi:hypothetical protein